MRAAVWTGVLLLGLAWAGPAMAHDPEVEEGEEGEDKAQSPSLFELSFGSAQTFRGSEMLNYSDEIKVIPTTSLLVILEYMISPIIRAAWIYNLPTTPEQFSVDGDFQERVVPSQSYLGLIWSPFRIDFASKSRIEFQLMTMAGISIEEKAPVFPVTIGRINFMQDSAAGVGIYFGAGYALFVDKFSFIYGVGYRF